MKIVVCTNKGFLSKSIDAEVLTLLLFYINLNDEGIFLWTIFYNNLYSDFSRTVARFLGTVTGMLPLCML